MSFEQWISFAQTFGLPLAMAIGGLIILAATGAKKAWVFGWVYTELKEDRDKLVTALDELTKSHAHSNELMQELYRELKDARQRSEGRQW